MKCLKLSDGDVVKIDDSDYENISRYDWSKHSEGYAYTSLKGKVIYMHRLIMNPEEHDFVDHINGDRLDNRKSNLRLCSITENSFNKSKLNTRKTTSKYKGVVKRENGKYYVSLKNHASFYVGLFSSEIAGANAYNYYAEKLYGEFAKLNDVPFMKKEEWMEFKLGAKKSIKPSKYIGVSWHKRHSKWMASVYVQGKCKLIGYYDDECEGAFDRDKYILDNNLDLKKYKLNLENGVVLNEDS